MRIVTLTAEFCASDAERAHILAEWTRFRQRLGHAGRAGRYEVSEPALRPVEPLPMRVPGAASSA